MRIRAYLEEEMRKQGHHVAATHTTARKSGGNIKRDRARLEIRRGREESRGWRTTGVRGGVSGDKGEMACLTGGRRRGRWGNSDEDNDDEDNDDDDMTRIRSVPAHKNRWSKAMDSPPKDFTISSLSPPRNSELYSDGRTHNPDANSRDASNRYIGSALKGTFNPLGQFEIPGPSLISEVVEEKGREAMDEDGHYPVVDNWLVVDVKNRKRKRKERDHSVERESRAMLGLAPLNSTGTNSANSQAKNALHHPIPPASMFTSPSSRMLPDLVTNQEVDIDDDNRRRRVRDDGRDGYRDGGVDCGEVRRRSRGGVQIVSSSESSGENASSEDDEDFKRWKANKESRQHKHSHLHISLSPPCPPLRIKVHILNSSYLIPCPQRLSDRKDTPLSWLIGQATERYFSQQGRRPVLSLRTADGASLCPADSIVHVLRQDEEVVGIVEQWFSPPLAERYLVACRTSGVGMCGGGGGMCVRERKASINSCR